MKKSKKVTGAWNEALMVADSLEIVEAMCGSQEYISWEGNSPHDMLLRGGEVASQEEIDGEAFVLPDDGNGCWVFYGASEAAVALDVEAAARKLREDGRDPSRKRFSLAVKAMREISDRVRTDPRGGTAYWEAESQIATVRVECYHGREEVFVNWASPGSMDPDKATRLRADICKAVDMARAARAAMGLVGDDDGEP